jgi:hypothetical protein
MEKAQSNIHYELVPPLPVASRHAISAFQWGHQAFPFIKVKTTDGNASSHTLFSAYPFNYGERLIHCIGTWQAQSHEVQYCVTLFVLHVIYFVFVKALRWWGVTISTQPHVDIYMFGPYVISTLYWLLEEYKWELSTDYFLVQFFSQLYT